MISSSLNSDDESRTVQSIECAEIVNGLPRSLGYFSSLENFEIALNSLGYTRLADCEWLPDDDFDFDFSTTFTSQMGELKIVCFREQIDRCA